MTMIDPKLASALRARMEGMRAWMADEVPYAAADQQHLNADTPECAYWHYGYMSALKDVLDLAERWSSQALGSEDK